MAISTRASAQIIPFPSSRSRRFDPPNSVGQKRARQLIQRTIEIMLREPYRQDSKSGDRHE